MSNFAERLVTRSAGTPLGSGISVLASRPVSRFEPVAGIEVEETVSSDLTPPQADRRIAQRETERAFPKTEAARSRPGETSTPILQSRPRGADPKPQVLTAPLMAVPNAIEATLDHAIQDAAFSDIPAVKDDAPKQVTQSTSRGEDAPAPQHVSADAMSPRLGDETEEIQAAPPRAFGRKLEIESAQVDRPMRTAGHASASGEEKSEQSPAPAISIGKIEVRFLPQEPRTPAPQPQPQRTRGFDAYARARRGEPR